MRESPVTGIALAIVISVTFAGVMTTALQTAAPRAVVLVGGTLIDGSGAPPRPNEAILIERGHIRSLGAELSRRPRPMRCGSTPRAGGSYPD